MLDKNNWNWCTKYTSCSI